MKAVNDGLILDLSTIVPEYCPNYNALLESNAELKQQIITDEVCYMALLLFARISAIKMSKDLSLRSRPLAG